MPLRKRIAAVRRQLAEKPEAGILALYLLIAALLLLVPPCTEMVRDYPSFARFWYAQHPLSVYRLLWERGQSRIDYGALLTEQLALAALFGAAYLSYCAFRGKRPW